MKMIITGATGFLGFRACEYFHELGYEVIGIGRNEQKGKELMDKGIRFVKLDLTNREAFIQLCENIDAIVHSAALSEAWGAYDDFYEANVVATQNVLEAVKIKKVKRLVHISTPSIYFNLTSRENVKEDAPLPDPFVNAYARTKYMAEQEVQKAVQSGVHAVILRPRALFGPRDTTILPKLIELNQTRGIPLPNAGNTLTDLTYVDNVVRAIELALNAPKSCVGEAYNITNGEPIQLKKALEKLFQAINMPMRTKRIPYPLLKGIAGIIETIYRLLKLNSEPLITKYSISVLGETQTLNIDKAKNELGYEPIVSIEEGITTYAAWWKRQNQKDTSI